MREFTIIAGAVVQPVTGAQSGACPDNVKSHLHTMEMMGLHRGTLLFFLYVCGTYVREWVFFFLSFSTYVVFLPDFSTGRIRTYRYMV